MGRLGDAVLVATGLGLLACLWSCSPPAQLPSGPSLDQMPLLLAAPLLQAGYQVAGYHEVDIDRDGSPEVLAVFSTEVPIHPSLGTSLVLFFSQEDGAWSLGDQQEVVGLNARTELQDVTGDGVAELIVFSQTAEKRAHDAIAPTDYTNILTVYAYRSNRHLVELGSFSSHLEGVPSPRNQTGSWSGQPAIYVFQDVNPPVHPFFSAYRRDTFVWQEGQGFIEVQSDQRLRLSPEIRWLIGGNLPWATGGVVLTGGVSLAVLVLVYRSGFRERWFVVGLGALVLVAAVGIGLAREVLCAPVLVVAGTVGLLLGRDLARRWVSRPALDRSSGPPAP